MIVRDTLREVLRLYRLRLAGTHGVSHWGRVMENGRRLAATSGADLDVVELFAVLHDACRFDDDVDRDHGRRAAVLASELRGRTFDLGDRRFALLRAALAGHVDGLTSSNATVGTCWDADRLDIGRVGTDPIPRYMSTEAGRDARVIAWATERALDRHVPGLVLGEWGIDLSVRSRT
ncbi:MAG: hypothetical protein ACOY3Y_07925 [Acidobacteriota bacterium]